jgi:hypothetical protein
MVVSLPALWAGHALRPEKFCYSLLLEDESTPKAIVQLEGLGKLKKI